MTQPLQLNYAPARRNWRKRVFLVLATLILITSALSVRRWGPNAWYQSQILYWQRQCTSFTAPADKVVYEGDPVAARQFASLLGYSTVPGRSASPVIFYPRCLEKLRAIEGSNPKLLQTKAIFYLGERVSAAGHHKLLGLGYYPEQFDEFSLFEVYSKDLNTSTVHITYFGPDSPAPDPLLTHQLTRLISGSNLRIFAGQDDPADAAHFTVRYRLWGQDDVMDGRLLDDGQVTLMPRNPPIRPR